MIPTIYFRRENGCEHLESRRENNNDEATILCNEVTTMARFSKSTFRTYQLQAAKFYSAVASSLPHRRSYQVDDTLCPFDSGCLGLYIYI